MAPVAQTPSASHDAGSYDGSRPRFESLQAWLEIYGEAEYGLYQKDHADLEIGYEEWAKSVHAHGMYLWHAALDVWEEPSSSDESGDVGATTLVLRGPSERKPKRSLTTNGHGMRRNAKTPKSTSREKSDEPTGSGKKRRKAKKKFLSEELIGLEDSDDIEEPTPLIETASPEAPSPPALNAATNGRRKSGGRRKKQFLSEETIQSEDEDTDAKSIDTAAAAAADTVTAFDALALERRHSPVPVAKVERPKGKPGRPRKKILSQETIPLHDDDDSAPPDSVRSNTGTASPESGRSSLNSRRGLRARTAAQQRPYAEDAKFEEQLLIEPETERVVKRSPKPKPTKLAHVSFPESEPEVEVLEIEELEPGPEQEQEPDSESEIEDKMLVDFEPDTIVVDVDERPTSSGRKAHYKGKGRAWKKTSEDEDEDFKSPVKIKVAQPKRQLARRKSAPMSLNVVQDEDDLDVEMEPATKPAIKTKSGPGIRGRPPNVRKSLSKAEKPKRKLKKSSTLSEEFVREDSDTEMEDERDQEDQQEQTPVIASPVHRILKLKMRKGSFDRLTPSKDTSIINEDEDSGPPSRKKSTPKSQSRKTRLSIVSRKSSVENIVTDENGDVEYDVKLLSPLQKPRKRKSVGSDGGSD